MRMWIIWNIQLFLKSHFWWFEKFSDHLWWNATVKTEILTNPLFQEFSVVAVSPPNLQNVCIAALLQSLCKRNKLLLKLWNSLSDQWCLQICSKNIYICAKQGFQQVFDHLVLNVDLVFKYPSHLYVHFCQGSLKQSKLTKVTLRKGFLCYYWLLGEFHVFTN